MPVVLCLVLTTYGATALAQTKTATRTTLTVTSGGNGVTAVPSGTVVSLTASVKAGTTALTTGQVDFCDASAKYCTDIHVPGMAQLTSAGTAILKFRPGIGSHSYKAVFLGTNTYAGSSSSTAPLAVTGTPGPVATATTIAESGAWGNYTLTATVTEAGQTTAPTGTVSFLDANNGNSVVATGTLGPAVAGIGWPNPKAINAGGTRFVLVADLNGDGIPDLVVNENPVVIYLGNADGTYSEAAIPSISGPPAGPMVIADFNGDGIPDLAVAMYGLATVSILLGKGDGTFAAPVVANLPSTATEVSQLVAADFNGDGIPDLAVVDNYDSIISILLGNGDGTFTTGSAPSISVRPAGIATGDFNGDGKADLAVADSYSDSTVILLGNGDGTFTTGETVHSGTVGSETGGLQITAADFNGDGKLDLAVAAGGTAGTSESVTILTGNGDGTFNSSFSGQTPTSTLVTWIQVADFNQDGAADVVLADSNGNATVFLNNGSGSFSQSYSVVTGLSVPYYLMVGVGDLNGDGYPDIVAGGYYNSTPGLYLTEPTETATASADITVVGVGQHQVDASYGGDTNYNPSVSGTTPLWGVPPATTTTLTMSSGGVPVTSVLPGSVVTLTATVQTGATPVTQGQVNFCDASTTQCTDIHLLGTAALSSGGTATYKFVPGPGMHSYRAMLVQDGYGLTSSSGVLSLTVGPAPTPIYSDTTAISLGGDPGDYSLTATVIGYGGSAAPTGNISFLDTSFGNTALGTAVLGSSTPGLGWIVSQTPAAANPPTSELAGDFNGDGIPDLALVWVNGSSEYLEGTVAVTVFFGKGDGTFTAGPTTQTQIDLDTIAAIVMAGDFNGDGKTDLALLTSPFPVGTNSITTLLGNGDGTFTASAPSSVSYPPQGGGDVIGPSMVAADFNGDGKLDLAIVGDYVAGGVAIMLGNGDGTFTQKGQSIEPNSGYGAIATGDFNGDGIPDLIAFDYLGPGAATVLLGNGDGTFIATTTPPAVESFVRSTVVGDFNGDGKPDLIVAYNSGFSVFLGNGDGTFDHQYDSPSLGALSLVAGDFNHDGKLDLAAIGGNLVELYLGAGNGTFTATSTTPSGSQVFPYAFALAMADFNGDGVPDLAMLSQGVDTASILLAEPTQTATATVTNIAPLGAGTHNVDASYMGDGNYTPSVSGTVALTAALTPLAISPAPGTYSTQQTITISESIPGATIYYYAWGTVNTNGFVPYTAPIPLTEGGTETIEAYAAETGYQQSNYIYGTYYMNLPGAPAPAFSPLPGVYPGTQTVHITDSVSAATIYYTTNGTTPTAASAQYTGPVTVSSSDVLAATAIAPGYSMSPATSGQYTISSIATSFIYTVAGTDGNGYSGDGSLATRALLNGPSEAIADPAGNLYISDTGNNVVRKVAAATGIITTIAGNSLAGYSGDDGPATSAELDGPASLALDKAGNLYIADENNCVIRKVTAAIGVITTYAGNGSCSTVLGDNGPATSAGLEYPTGLAVDVSGNLYISDAYNYRVRKVAAATGTITTIAGGGTESTVGFNGNGGAATSAFMNEPEGLTLDGAGDLFIADAIDNVVLEVNATTQVISIVAGNGYGAYGSGGYTGDGGPATSAELYYPEAVAVDSADNLYISDNYNGVIREVNWSNHVINTWAGHGNCYSYALSGDGGPATDATLCYPGAISFDGAGNLYVTGPGSSVHEITALASPPTTTTASPVFSPTGGTFAVPQTVTLTDATPGAEIYLTYDGTQPTTYSDEYRDPIRVNGAVTLTAIAVAPGYLPSAPTAVTYTISAPPPAIVSTVAGNGSTQTATAGALAMSTALGNVEDVAIDKAGNLYIPDFGNNVVWQVSATSGIASVVAGTLDSPGWSGNGGPATSAQLYQPTRVALDNAGNLYISDTGNRQVRQVNMATGIISAYAGDYYTTTLGDGGPAVSAALSYPQGLAFDGQNNLYIADTGDHRVRMVPASSGIITTFAGGAAYNAPLGDGGPAASARLWDPIALTLDRQGNLYIAESGEARVRKVEASTGIITTLAGNGDRGTSGDGLPATQAEVDPGGIAIDSAGDFYIADGPVVRELAAGSNVLTTVVGNGYYGFSGEGLSATLATLCSPQGLAFDGSGNLLVADWCNDRIRKVTFQNTTATPVFSPIAGTYAGAQPVSISDETPNAVICYTTDGSTPTAGSALYNGAITVSSTQTLKAIAYASGRTPSGVATATYTFNPALMAPTVTVTPLSSSITTLQPLSVGVTVSGGSGNPTPTGSVTLTGGGYSSVATTLSAGNATIDIPAGSLDTGGDTLTVTYTPDSNSSSFYSAASGSSSVTVMFLSVWVVDGTGGSSELNANGSGMTSGADPGASIGIAVDNGGNIWTIGSGTPPLEETSPSALLVDQVAGGAGGLDLPAAIAIDGDSRVWIANGSNSVSLFSNTGAALSPASGFTGGSIVTPKGIAIDLAGSVWIANKGNNSVTRILGVAAPIAPLATAVANNTTGAKP